MEIRNKHRNNILNRFKNETLRHFVAKAVMFHLLCKLEHDIRTEWRVPNGYVDIVDLTTQTIYEIELSAGKGYRDRKIDLYDMPGFEVIVLDCHNLPSSIDEIAKYLEQFIHPD